MTNISHFLSPELSLYIVVYKSEVFIIFKNAQNLLRLMRKSLQKNCAKTTQILRKKYVISWNP